MVVVLVLGVVSAVPEGDVVVAEDVVDVLLICGAAVVVVTIVVTLIKPLSSLDFVVTCCGVLVSGAE